MDRLTRSMQTVKSHMSPFQLLIQYDVVRIEQHMVVIVSCTSTKVTNTINDPS